MGKYMRKINNNNNMHVLTKSINLKIHTYNMNKHVLIIVPITMNYLIIIPLLLLLNTHYSLYSLHAFVCIDFLIVRYTFNTSTIR